MKNLPTNKSPRPDGIKGKFHKKIQEKASIDRAQALPEKCRGRKTPTFNL